MKVKLTKILQNNFVQDIDHLRFLKFSIYSFIRLNENMKQNLKILSFYIILIRTYYLIGFFINYKFLYLFNSHLEIHR